MITNAAECSHITVVWMDSAVLPVEVNVQYIKAGISDIKKYVEMEAKPELEKIANNENLKIIVNNLNQVNVVGENINQVNSVATKLEGLNDLSVWLKVRDISVLSSQWTEDNTYPEYAYVANIAVEGCNADYIPHVIFKLNDVLSQNMAPIAEAVNGYVKIWAKEQPDNDIVIPTILLQ